MPPRSGGGAFAVGTTAIFQIQSSLSSHRRPCRSGAMVAAAGACARGGVEGTAGVTAPSAASELATMKSITHSLHGWSVLRSGLARHRAERKQGRVCVPLRGSIGRSTASPCRLCHTYLEAAFRQPPYAAQPHTEDAEWLPMSAVVCGWWASSIGTLSFTAQP